MGTVQIAQEHVLPLYDCWIGVCVQNFGVHIFVKESSGCPPWGSHFRISADLNTPGRTWPGRGWESRPDGTKNGAKVLQCICQKRLDVLSWS